MMPSRIVVNTRFVYKVIVQAQVLECKDSISIDDNRGIHVQSKRSLNGIILITACEWSSSSSSFSSPLRPSP